MAIEVGMVAPYFITRIWEFAASIKWPVWSGLGILFGLICAWLWIKGSIGRTAEYREGKTEWMITLAGRPKPGAVISGDFANILGMALSVIGFLASMALFQLAGWRVMQGGDLLEIFVYQTSAPLSLLLTWGLIAWQFERFVKRQKKAEGQRAGARRAHGA